ncbi:MAG: hypothetical protein RL095_1118 [Verrucomicrobiota bacterium]|jgi:VCBS repeat-containing protein
MSSLATLTFNNILINEGQSTVLDSANFDVATRFEKISGGRFIVDKVLGGHFTLNGKTSKFFTQSELDLGLVSFVDNGNEFSPFFSIRYVGPDGVTASNSILFNTAGDSNGNKFNTFNDLADVDVTRLAFKAYDADPTFGIEYRSSSILTAKHLKITDPDSNKKISFGEHGIRINIFDSTEYTLEHYVREEGVGGWVEASEGVTYNEVLAGKVRLVWNGDAADSNIKLEITDSSYQGIDNTQVITLFTRFDAVRTGGNVAEQLGKLDYTPPTFVALRDGRTVLSTQQLQLFERQDADYVEIYSGTGKDSGYLYTVSSVKGGYFELKDSRTIVENGESRTDDVYVKTSSFTLADLAAGNVIFHSTGKDNISWKAKVRDPGGLISGSYNFSGYANSAPVVNEVSLTLMVAEDTTTSSRIIAADREGDVLSYELSGTGVTLSGGNYILSTAKGTITLNASTGNYSYNPKLDATGNDSFTVIVSDNNASTEVNVSVIITPFGENTVGSFDVSALETSMIVVGPTPSNEGYTYSIQGFGTTWVNNTWGTLTINPNTGVYTLDKSAKPNFFGEIDFTIIATKNGESMSYPATITISNVNDAPSFNISYTNKDAYIDTLFVLVLDSATDPDLGLAASTEKLTYTATFNNGALPGWLTFDPDTRTFSGTPTSNATNGTITVTVTDSANVSVSDSFTITLKGLDDKPWAPSIDTSATTVLESGLPTSIASNLLNGWFNSFGSSTIQSPSELRVSEVVGGAWTTDLVHGEGFLLYVTGDKVFVKADGTLIVDIDHSKWQHLSAGEKGSFSFTYKVTDNHGTPSNSADDTVSYERLVTVTVTGEDSLYTANDDSVSLNENVLGTVSVAANIGILSNDSDLDTNDKFYVHSAKLSTSNTYTTVDSDPSNGLSSTSVDIQGVYGTLSIKADGSYIYTVNNADVDTQALGAGSNASEIFDVRSGSYFGTAISPQIDTSTLTITIVGEDDKPTLKSNNAIVIDTHGQAGDSFSHDLRFTDLFIDLDGNEGELISVTDQNGLAIDYNLVTNNNGIFDGADILMLLNLKSNNDVLNGVGSTLTLGFDNSGDAAVDYYLSVNLLLIDSVPGVP